MLEWIASNLANIIITTVLILIVALVIRVLVRDRKAGISSCSCKCSGCAMAGKCHGSQHSTLTNVGSLKS